MVSHVVRQPWGTQRPATSFFSADPTTWRERSAERGQKYRQFSIHYVDSSVKGTSCPRDGSVGRTRTPRSQAQSIGCFAPTSSPIKLSSAVQARRKTKRLFARSQPTRRECRNSSMVSVRTRQILCNPTSARFRAPQQPTALLVRQRAAATRTVTVSTNTGSARPAERNARRARTITVTFSAYDQISSEAVGVYSMGSTMHNRNIGYRGLLG